MPMLRHAESVRVGVIVGVVATACVLVVIAHTGWDARLALQSAQEAGGAVALAEKRERAAEAREQRMLREVWGVAPRQSGHARHIAPEESIAQGARAAVLPQRPGEFEQELQAAWGMSPHHQPPRHIAPEESIVRAPGYVRAEWPKEKAKPSKGPKLGAERKGDAAKHAARAKNELFFWKRKGALPVHPVKAAKAVAKKGRMRPWPLEAPPLESRAQEEDGIARTLDRLKAQDDVRIDSTLEQLKKKAKALGMSFDGERQRQLVEGGQPDEASKIMTMRQQHRVTRRGPVYGLSSTPTQQLDDLPTPDLEYGSTTPDIPFPPNVGGAQGKAAMQTLAAAVAGDDKFEAAGINVNSDSGSQPGMVLPDVEDADVDPLMVYPTIQFATTPATGTLYAPAWSPDYLEPARHAPTDSEAWSWIARAKKQEQVYEREEAAKLEGTEATAASPAAASAPGRESPPSAPAGEHASKAAQEQELAQVALESASKDPCPWYGCADGSDSLQAWNKRERRHAAESKMAKTKEEDTGKKEATPASHRGETTQEHGGRTAAPLNQARRKAKDARRTTPQVSGSRVAQQATQEQAKALRRVREMRRVALAKRILGARKDARRKNKAKRKKAADRAHGASTQQLLAHGFGTTNAFTADPITAPHDQFYGGEHRFYGADRPVIARGGQEPPAGATAPQVRAHEAFAADGKTAVYDINEPHSFDSVPLASPSSFAARVEAHFPNGYDADHATSTGKLQAKLFRGQVLADWRKYEHGLTQCMEAEATIDPNLKDYSCADVATGLQYLQSCMQNHRFGLASLTDRDVLGPLALQRAGMGAPAPAVDARGAWGALPRLIQLTYQLYPKDYEAVHRVLSNSAVFGALWNMERLHARCAATGSAVMYRTRGDRVRQIDNENRYLDHLIKWWFPGTPEQQKGEAIIQGAYKGLPWEHASMARGAARNYFTYANSKYPDASAYPNLPKSGASATPQFYGPETDYRAEDWEAPGLKRAYHRADLPRWRVPQAPRSPRWRAEHRAVPNPAGEAGSLGDYTMQQPRAKLDVHSHGDIFPVSVNGRPVDPARPRPWQADRGAYNPWTGYLWTGPGAYDAVAEAHPRTLYTTGYDYPTSVRPEVVQACEGDGDCRGQEVCSTGGYCRRWHGASAWHVPAASGLWRSDSGVAESWV